MSIISRKYQNCIRVFGFFLPGVPGSIRLIKSVFMKAQRHNDAAPEAAAGCSEEYPRFGSPGNASELSLNHVVCSGSKAAALANCRLAADRDRHPSGGPVGARLCPHPRPGASPRSQLPVAVAPPSEHNGSTAFSGLKRPVVNEQNQQKPPLVLHLPAF